MYLSSHIFVPQSIRDQAFKPRRWHALFFQFKRNKSGIFSRSKRDFELFYSLLVTRLKKFIKMDVMWKFSEDARKFFEIVYTFFMGEKQYGLKMSLEHA